MACCSPCCKTLTETNVFLKINYSNHPFMTSCYLTPSCFSMTTDFRPSFPQTDSLEISQGGLLFTAPFPRNLEGNYTCALNYEDIYAPAKKKRVIRGSYKVFIVDFPSPSRDISDEIVNITGNLVRVRCSFQRKFFFLYLQSSYVVFVYMYMNCM